MLSIGEFSSICKVSAKTLRYYAEIGLILPDEINPETGYRYYSIRQLETMLFIDRLKSYNFSLDEIKALLAAEGPQDETLYRALAQKKNEISSQARALQTTLCQLEADLCSLQQGRPIMSYLEQIDVQLAEVPGMYLLSTRTMVQEQDFARAYGSCFGRLFRRIAEDGFTPAAPPMVLFHSAEFTAAGMDTEFAVPIKEYATGTRDFCPGLCLKTVLQGEYSGLPSVYAKQREWAEKEGYEPTDALYEVYVTDPSQAASESELLTEVYSPVKKRPKQPLREK